MRRLLLLLVPVLLLPLLASAPASAGERSWRGLDVPYLAGGTVHFRGNVVRVPNADPDVKTNLLSLAATRHAAVLQADERTLHLLPAGRGRLELIATHLVGLPMADPVGDWVFWTAEREAGGVRLMGYDTRRGLLRAGPALPRFARVWAVDGRTAYAGDPDRRILRWTPGEGAWAVRVPDDRILTDAHDGRLALADPDDEERLPDAFDPSGRYLARFYAPRVEDAVTRATVRLRLGRWTPVHQLWAPSGELVVVAAAGRDIGDGSRARRFVCDPATGACDTLPGPLGGRRFTVGHLPWTPSAWLQVVELVGS